MKSLQRRFSNTAAKHPNLSSYMCFARAVRGQGFSRRIIATHFSKLVEKDDYAHTEKRALLKNLYELSATPGNRAEAGMI